MSMLLMVAAMKAKLGNPIRKLVLIKLADNANDDGICWPSYRHIADQCEIDRKTAMRHVDWLEENKFLSKQYRKDDERGNKSNVYRIDIASGTAHLVAQNTQPSGTESPAPSVTESPRTSHSFEPINEPVILGTSADAPCGVCGGYKFMTYQHLHAFGRWSTKFVTKDEDGVTKIPCDHCNGTGKEPACNDGLQDQGVRNSRITEQPKPKKPTKAQALVDLVRENPEQWPALNCVDDNLLTEWAKLRTRKGASSEQRALNTIEKTLQELRTVHGIAPDTALAAQCDAGWATVKVEYLVKNGRPMAAPVKSGAPCPTSAPLVPLASEMTEEQREASRARIKAMTKD